METGNNVPAAHARHGAHVRDANQRQLRDIEELVARLRVVTKQLQFPAKTSSAAAAAHAPAHGPLGTTSRDEARRSEHAEGERN
jgi:hypothetical protein